MLKKTAATKYFQHKSIKIRIIKTDFFFSTGVLKIKANLELLKTNHSKVLLGEISIRLVLPQINSESLSNIYPCDTPFKDNHSLWFVTYGGSLFG